MQSGTRVLRAATCVALAMLSIALFDQGKAFAQAPQSKFAEVNGVNLHYLIAGKGDPVVLLHGYVAAVDIKTFRQTYRDRAGPARLRSIVRASGWLHQGGNGAGHPRINEEPQI